MGSQRGPLRHPWLGKPAAQRPLCWWQHMPEMLPAELRGVLAGDMARVECLNV